MAQIVIRASICRSDLEACKKASGKLNSGRVTLNEKVYDLHTVLYTGFGGTLSDVCVGRHTFEEITCDEPRRKYLEYDFSSIPGLENPDASPDSTRSTVSTDPRNVPDDLEDAGSSQRESDECQRD